MATLRHGAVRMPRPHRRWRRWKLIVAGIVGVLVLAAIAGALYERQAVRRDARRFPPPGQLVDVGGRRLHLQCLGSGSPVVVFEPPGFGNSTSFRVARAAIAARTRVCSYDRVGMGWSDPGPREISGGLLIEDLRRLLDAVKIDAPIVIVASSIGGLTAELFARRHPGRVAGLVFLDAANSEAIVRAAERNLPMLVRPACSAVAAAGSVGLIRLLDPWDLRHERTEQAARSARLMYGAKPWVMLCAVVRGGRTTLAEFAAASPLRRELPITALSAETRNALLPPALARLIGTEHGVVPGLRETHQHLAQQSAHGTWRVVPGSDHLIASSRPQAVVDAVREMISVSARTAGR